VLHSRDWLTQRNPTPDRTSTTFNFESELVDDPVVVGAKPKRKHGLCGRLWNDHFQHGNAGSDLVQQVMNKHSLSRDDARVWIAQKCVVQWLVEEDTELLCWAEHYMLSILRPNRCMYTRLIRLILFCPFSAPLSGQANPWLVVEPSITE
jgi:hypothetical protein